MASDARAGSGGSAADGRRVDIAVDIGGTFTDVVGWDGARFHLAKVSSRPDRPADAVVEGIDVLLRSAGLEPARVRRFVHSTTIATNAVLERKGAKVGLLMTEGFEDVLEIGRQKRSAMYELFLEPETPGFIAPGRRRAGIRERIDADGEITVPLDEEGVIRATRRLVEEENIEAIAVCYLFCFRNPAHERRTRELIRAHWPEMPISLSFEIDPVFREYERTCATAFDAYVRPVMVGYLERLGGALKARGIAAPIEIMQSGGGVASFRQALERPVSSLLCGPAAGAVGGSVAGGLAGHTNLVTIDIGGTSTDVAIVLDGRLEPSREGRIGGYPLRVPMVGVHTIGAGGGSIARLDEAGALKVGPESAGAEPGPICYGRGGREVTVTDASLALGYLHPDWFARELSLEQAGSEAALGDLAARMEMAPLAAALGIHTVVNAAMTDAIRALTVERGHDPRDFALVALGGAGPLHAGAIAEALGIATVIVPPRPGVLAAEGLLHAPIVAEAYRTFAVPAETASASGIDDVFAELATQVSDELRRDGHDPAEATLAHAADMRYLGQSYEIEVPLATIDGTIETFRRRYRRLHGHASAEDPVEFVNLRVSATIRPPEISMCNAEVGAGREAAEVGPVCFDPVEGMIAVPFHRRDSLGAGSTLDGPAVIVQGDTTTLLRPRHRLRVDPIGNLIITLDGAT